MPVKHPGELTQEEAANFQQYCQYKRDEGDPIETCVSYRPYDMKNCLHCGHFTWDKSFPTISFLHWKEILFIVALRIEKSILWLFPVLIKDKDKDKLAAILLNLNELE